MHRFAEHATFTIAFAAFACGRSEVLDVPEDRRTRYLAFAADSQMLGAFELHVIDLDDPSLTPKIVSNGGDSSPVSTGWWSPDGRWLAFLESGLFVADAQNRFATRRIAELSGEPDWSPSGRWLAYIAALESPTVVLADALGLEPDVTEPLVQVDHHAYSWSPAHDAFLFTREASVAAPREWYVVTPGQSTRALGAAALGLAPRFAKWSPTGTYIAFEVDGPDDHFLVYVVDTREEPMRPRLALDAGSVDWAPYVWSGDGSLLLAGSRNGLFAIAVESGMGAQLVAEVPRQWEIGNHGLTLGYLSDISGKDGRQLFAHDLSAGRVSSRRLLEPGAVDRFVISATSDSILFRLTDDPSRVRHVRATGGPAVALHEPELTGANWEPPIAPTGRRVLLELQPKRDSDADGDVDSADEGRELRVVDAGSDARVRLRIALPPVTATGDFSWSGASRFSFLHDAGGWQSLFIADVGARTLSRVYDSPSTLREIRWTGWQP